MPGKEVHEMWTQVRFYVNAVIRGIPTGDHWEHDALARHFPHGPQLQDPLLQDRPRLQDGSNVPKGRVKHIEMTMKGVVPDVPEDSLKHIKKTTNSVVPDVPEASLRDTEMYQRTMNNMIPDVSDDSLRHIEMHWRTTNSVFPDDPDDINHIKKTTNSVVSDVQDDLVKHMEKAMNDVVIPKYGSSCESEQPPTIYRVPKELKGCCEQAYLPIAVELGLFAHQNPGGGHTLQVYKWRCLSRLIGRHHLLREPERTPVLLRRCLDALESLEPRIRSSYHPREQRYVNGGAKQELLRNMLLDGCFILHRLLKYARIDRIEAAGSTSGSSSGNAGEEEDDDWTQMFGRCWVWGFVTCDLLLLENQIPFFVLEKLFEQLRTDPDESSDIVVAGALRLFQSLHPQRLHSTPITCHGVHHLLHLFHRSVGLPEEGAVHGDARRHAVAPSELPQWIPCARDLEEAGIEFQARKAADARSFLDVRFHKGVLEVPTLQLCDYSEPLFRNMIAFEQTYPLVPCQVTAYVAFMDCLIASREDMRLLELSGVLVNHMSGASASDPDAVGFFARLSAEAHLAAKRNYLADMMGRVNKYRQSSWPRWQVALVRNYCSSPWMAMSIATAALLVVLTLIQTFFAAYSYFKPPN